jgi:hypothetical protein
VVERESVVERELSVRWSCREVELWRGWEDAKPIKRDASGASEV